MKQDISAASTVLAASPSAGLYTTPFRVDLTIDGRGDAFNAAQAKVIASSNLAAENLVLGNCNFSFLQTPSAKDPSFAGVMLGSSAKKCTVYTLTLVPNKTGTASLSLTHATVRRYGDAADVLSSIQNGMYTIASVSASPVALPLPASTATIEASPQQNIPVSTIQSQAQTLFPISSVIIISAAGGIMTLLLFIFALLCFVVFRQQKTPFCLKHERGPLGSERNSR